MSKLFTLVREISRAHNSNKIYYTPGTRSIMGIRESIQSTQNPPERPGFNEWIKHIYKQLK